MNVKDHLLVRINIVVW